MSEDLGSILEIREQEKKTESSPGGKSIDVGDLGYDFRTLLSFGTVLTFIGWGAIILGAIVFIYGIVTQGLSSILGGVFFGIYGVLIVVAGQIIACFVTIERTTKGTYELLKKSVKMDSISDEILL